MEVVFLDANVLFSAAFRPQAGLLRLWELESTELISSSYAIEEARRNLSGPEQRKRCESFVRSLRVVPDISEGEREPLKGTRLPDKDVPILAAAVAARANYLLTGDIRHFGPLLGKEIAGVRMLTPAAYLRERLSRRS